MVAHKGKPDISADFAQLKANFAKKIPAKVEELSQLWEKSKLISADPNDFLLLHRQVHTLAGTSATFGFEEISKRAKSIETAIKYEMDEDPSIWAKETVNKISKLFVQLETKAKDKQEAKDVNIEIPQFSQPLGLSDRIRGKLVYLVDDDIDFLNAMKLQIQTFGYEVEAFSDLIPFEKAIKQIIPEVVIMDVMFGDGPMAGIEYIVRINKKQEQPLKTIFITGSQDVMTRLHAVRANGEAYFPKPVLVEHLIDALDRLTHQLVEEPYKIVIVDDTEEVSRFASLTLEHAGMQTREVNDPFELLTVLSEFPPDLILMDIYMPGCNGLELSRVIRQMDSYVSIPIVFFSSEGDLKKQLGAMSLGGDDFLPKPIEPWHLVSAVTSRVQRGRKIRKLAETDGLTGLINHSKGKAILEAELSRARRDEKSLSLAMLDIDHFKHVNDNYGHPAGDRVLKSLANMFKQRLRPYDTVCRYGGEEFIVILPDTDTQMARIIMERLRLGFSKIDHFSEKELFSCRFSCGIASFPDFDTGATISNEADKALYVAKEGGRNQTVIADKLSAAD